MTLHLASTGTLDVEHTLRVLKLHSLPSQERIDESTAQVHRVLRLDDHLVEVRLTLQTTGVSIEHDAPNDLVPKLRTTIDRWLGLSQDTSCAYASVHEQPTLARLARASNNLRLISYPTIFEALATTIIGQQVSLAAARTLAGRYVEKLGELHPCGLRTFPTAQVTASLDPLQLQAIIRCPLARATTLHTVASWYQNFGRQLAGQDQQFLAQLLALRGVGPWTKDYMALRGLRMPDVFLTSDLVIRRAIINADVRQQDIDRLPTPARYLATLLLWDYDARGQV